MKVVVCVRDGGELLFFLPSFFNYIRKEKREREIKTSMVRESIIESISLIDIDWFWLSISAYVSLVVFLFQEIGPFYLRYQTCGHRVVHTTPFLSFQCPWDQQ